MSAEQVLRAAELRSAVQDIERRLPAFVAAAVPVLAPQVVGADFRPLDRLFWSLMKTDAETQI